MMSGVSFGVGKLVGNYNKFNQQMSVVRSVAGDITDNEFEAMRQQAIALGSATAFTATEAAQGLESLARAGFSVEEAIGASRATLDLAAADSMGLAEAAGITAKVIRALGLSAENDSQRVADVLAKASASANTNVSELGESFKMGAATISLFGMELEEGTAILAKLADAGLKGTMAGTSFSNMMNKLVRPTSKAAKFMKDMNIHVTDANGKMRKVTDIVQDVGNALNAIPDKGDRVAMAMELTGLRGVKAVNGLMQALKDDGLKKLEADLKGANGAAKTMADERLNNLEGQITILKSATEGFTIRLFDMFKGLDGGVIRPVVEGMVALNEAWDDVKSAIDGGLLDQRKSELEQKHGSTMVAIVLGIRDGVNALRAAFVAVGEKVRQWSKDAERVMGPDAIRRITKLVVVVAGLAAVFGPVIAAVGLLAFVISSVLPVLQAVGAVASAAFWPIVLGVAAVGVAFAVMRREGESFSAFASRMWSTFKDAAVNAWENGIKPLWDGMKRGWEQIWPVLKSAGKEAIDAVKKLLLSLEHVWIQLTGRVGESKTDWSEVGRTAVLWFGRIVTGAIRLITAVIDIATAIVDAVRPAIVKIKNVIVDLWNNVIKPFLVGLMEGWRKVWPALKAVALEVFDAIETLITTVIEIWNDMTGGISSGSIDWQHWGTVAIEVLGWVITTAMRVVKFSINLIRVVIEVVADVVKTIVGYFKAVWEFMKRAVSIVTQFFGGLIEAFKMVAGGDVLGAFKTAGLAILNFLLSPIRLIVGAVADLVDNLLGLRAVKKLLPESQLDSMREFTAGLRKFADKGITLGDIPAEATKKPSKFVAPKIADTGEGDIGSFDFGGTSGVGGFGGKQLAELEAQKIQFEEQEKSRKEQEAKKMASDLADKTAAAVREGLEDTTLETTVNTTACVDGKEVSRSQAKHAQRLADRLGATTPPFVRRTSAEQGMIPSQ
jgi:TP901 family phage tail tape measure protein